MFYEFLALLFSVPIGYLSYKAVQIYYNHNYEFIQQPAITKDERYQHSVLLEKAWSLPTSQIYKKNSVMYQPRSGLCGHASLNNVLQSIDLSPLDYPRMRPFSLNGLRDFAHESIHEKLKLHSSDKKQPQIESVEAFPSYSYEDFRNMLKTQVNNPKYRFIANFLRTPLFFCDRGLLYSIRKVMNGHFSPVIAYLEEEDMVLILDTNSTFKTYLCPVERLFHGCNSRDFFQSSKNGHRGLIRITLKDPRS